MKGIDINEVRKATETTDVIGARTKEPWYAFLNRDISLFGNGLNDKKKERFYSGLSVLIAAGVDIKTALELVADEQEKENDKAVFISIRDQVINGGSLSQAIAATNKFTPYEQYSILIGEESGRLPRVLQELSTFFSSQMAQKRQLVNALAYPAIVVMTAFGAIFFMMKFVVPMFAGVFKRFRGNLPYLTKLVIKISGYFTHYSLLFLLGLITLVIFLYASRKVNWFRNYGARLVLRIPVVGGMIRKIYLARLCRSMSLLLGARTPLVESVGLVKKMIGFYLIEEVLESVEEDLLKGKSLFESLQPFGLFDKRMLSMIKVAEEVNQLDVIFEKLAQQYTAETEHQTALLSSIIEPVMIVFLGFFVALILIAMYLPLFRLSTMIH